MKVLKEIFKGFSIKKFLLSILCSIIISTFIGFTILFVTQSQAYMMVEITSEANQNSNEIKEMGNNMQKQYDTMKEHFSEQKEKYGENYPAEGVFLYQLTNLLSSSSICRTYTLTLLIGIILGTLVYIIFIQNATGIQMLLETTICGIIIVLLILLINFGYNQIINMAINELGASAENGEYIGYVYDIDNSNVIYIFLGIIGIAYIINLIYQKVLVDKFNIKLPKKK